MNRTSVTVPEPTPVIVNVTLLRKLQIGPPGTQSTVSGIEDVSPVAVIVICTLVKAVPPNVPDTGPLNVYVIGAAKDVAAARARSAVPTATLVNQHVNKCL